MSVAVFKIMAGDGSVRLPAISMKENQLKKGLLSKILIITLAFTMVMSQGSFAFAGEDIPETDESIVISEEPVVDPEPATEDVIEEEPASESGYNTLASKDTTMEDSSEEEILQPVLDTEITVEDFELVLKDQETADTEEETVTREEEADYTAVQEALAMVPEDLSIYTDESAQAVTDAVNAVVWGLPASEQEQVDAMASAIEEAVAALVEKHVDLTVTNTTGMFKAVSAYLSREDDNEYLVVAFSAKGYHEMFKGTYEEAVLNGDGSADNGNDTWTHGYTNSDGKWEFRFPLEDGESYLPIVAISNSYYVDYLNGSNPLERSFFPRQMVVDREAKTLVTGDYDETSDFEVTSNVADFKAAPTASTNVIGGPNSNNYTVSPVIEMQDGTYDAVIYPTVVDGKVSNVTTEIKDGKFEISMQNAPGIEAFKDKEPIDMTFHVAEDAPYNAAGKYVIRKVTIDKMARTITIDGTPLQEKGSDGSDDTVDPPVPDPDPGDQGDTGNGGSSGNTSAVDSSTTLPDGEYVPDSFSFSGGTGKLTITCTKIIIKNGQAYATIVFSSTKVDQLKAAGGHYYKQGSGYSTFTIPVNLNANNKIIARTTAMSQPHWVEYIIYIGLSEGQAEKADEAKKDAAEAKMKMSDEAPVILGLEATSVESTVEYSEYFKIFEYENGVKLLSIDISSDTELKEEYTANAEKALEASESEEALEYDEEGRVITKSKGEYTEALYKNNVVNYLLVPEDYEVPAGLDKEYIIVTTPVDKTFMASQEAIAMMEQLGCLDAISLLGIDEEAVESDELRKSIEKEDVLRAGDLEKPDFAKVVKDKTKLAVLPGALLPEAIDENLNDEEREKLAEEAGIMKDALETLESRFTALEVPVLIDRSAQEKDELARAEWIKVYGALFGCDELAAEIFEEFVKEAGNDED